MIACSALTVCEKVYRGAVPFGTVLEGWMNFAMACENFWPVTFPPTLNVADYRLPQGYRVVSQ